MQRRPNRCNPGAPDRVLTTTHRRRDGREHHRQGRRLLGLHARTPSTAPPASRSATTLGEFGPDGQHLAGFAACYPEVVGEDDSDLVTTVVTGNWQYVGRFGLDGTVERIDTDAEDPAATPIKLMP